jgi:hypothetical protein
MMAGEEEHDNVVHTTATPMSRGPQGEPTTPKGRMKATMPTLRASASIAKGSQRTMAETEGGGNTTRDNEGQQQMTTMDNE